MGMGEPASADGEWKSDVTRVSEILEKSAQDNLEKYYPEFLSEQGEGEEDADESGDGAEPAELSGEDSDAGEGSGEAQEDHRGAEGSDSGSAEEGAAADDESGGEDEDQPTDDEQGQLDLKALAEKVGVEVSDLYGVRVAMGQGREPLTLGELKDSVNDLHTIEERREALVSERIDHQNAVLRDQHELSYIVDVMGEVPDELRQLAAEKHQIEATKQREKLLNIFPGWKDPQEYVGARERMIGAIGELGLSETDLSLVNDARWIKLIHDYAELSENARNAEAGRKRLRKLPKKVKQRQPRKPPNKASRRDQMLAKARASDKPEDKYAAVSVLLNDKGGR
jgi:hypothetical protein